MCSFLNKKIYLYIHCNGNIPRFWRLWWQHVCDDTRSLMATRWWCHYICDTLKSVMLLNLWYLRVRVDTMSLMRPRLWWHTSVWPPGLGWLYVCDGTTSVMSPDLCMVSRLWWHHICDAPKSVMHLSLWWHHDGYGIIFVMPIDMWWPQVCVRFRSVMSPYLRCPQMTVLRLWLFHSYDCIISVRLPGSVMTPRRW